MNEHTRPRAPISDAQIREFVQEVLKADKVQPPATLFDAGTDDLGLADIPRERYFARQYHDLEVEKMWSRVWQMACWSQDIPNPGDVSVYELADTSIIVVRQDDGSLKAFHNACLHRGRRLRDADGHVSALRCPFHGFTWAIDGRLSFVPSRWDFPQIEDKTFCLPEVRVEEWNGFAFVNLDPAAPPLLEYLEDVPAQWAAWDLTQRYKSAHVIREVPANWKLVLEAFIESFHAMTTHPEAMPFTGMEPSQYDVYPGRRHFSRAVTLIGFPPYMGQASALGDQQLVENFIQTYAPQMAGDPDRMLAPGETARDGIYRVWGKVVSQMFDYDVTGLSPADVIDAIWYHLFPNFMPWPTLGYPLFYRFRPKGNDPERSLMEIIILSPFKGERPLSAPTVYQDAGGRLADVLGPLGAVLDQDMANMEGLQAGVKASVKPGFTLSRYQESRIRRFHKTLEEYVGR